MTNQKKPKVCCLSHRTEIDLGIYSRTCVDSLSRTTKKMSFRLQKKKVWVCLQERLFTFSFCCCAIMIYQTGMGGLFR